MSGVHGGGEYEEKRFRTIDAETKCYFADNGTRQCVRPIVDWKFLR